MIRDVYQREGLGDKFDPDSVRFIIGPPIRVSPPALPGIILREQAAATLLHGRLLTQSRSFC